MNRGGATSGPGRSYALPLKNRTWRWDLSVILWKVLILLLM